MITTIFTVDIPLWGKGGGADWKRACGCCQDRRTGASCKLSVPPGTFPLLLMDQYIQPYLCAMLRLPCYFSPCPSLLVVPSMLEQIPVSVNTRLFEIKRHFGRKVPVFELGSKGHTQDVKKSQETGCSFPLLSGVPTVGLVILVGSGQSIQNVFSLPYHRIRWSRFLV